MVKRKGDEKRYPPMLTTTWLSWLARQLRAHNQTIFFLEQLQPDWLPPSQRIFYQWSTRLFLWLLFGLLTGLAVGLANGLFFGLANGLFFGLLASVLFSGAISGPIFSDHYKLDTNIEPAEALSWSWKEFRIGLRSGLVYGLFFGLFVGLVYGLRVGLLAGLVLGLLAGLVCVLMAWFSGFSGKQLTDHLTLFPNEGIRRSLKHGLFFSTSCLFFGLFFGLLAGLTFGLLTGLLIGLVFGLLFGLLTGLHGGLNAVEQHFILRFWFARSGVFPWKAVPFLEDATTRILLRRVGGGYSFTHRLLLDHFADLDLTQSSGSTNAQPTESSQPEQDL